MAGVGQLEDKLENDWRLFYSILSKDACKMNQGFME